MTHTYALVRLLEHGPLTMAELIEITRWSWNAVRSALGRLIEAGRVRAVPVGNRRNAYALT